MRFLHFADLHLDTPFRWAPPELARARRQGLRQTLVRICRLAAEHQVDALTCGGDLYENERFTPDTAELLRATFAELHPLPVFLAPGNHDWYGPRSLYRQVEWSPNVRVFDAAALIPVPARRTGSRFRVDRDGVHVALFHGSEQHAFPLQGEGKAPHAPFRAEQIAQAGLVHALLGHFHTPTEAPTHTYPGNPDPLTFGETGSRGAVLLTVEDNGTVSRQRFTVATSAVHDVPVDLTGVTDSGRRRPPGYWTRSRRSAVWLGSPCTASRLRRRWTAAGHHRRLPGAPRRPPAESWVGHGPGTTSST